MFLVFSYTLTYTQSREKRLLSLDHGAGHIEFLSHLLPGTILGVGSVPSEKASCQSSTFLVNRTVDYSKQCPHAISDGVLKEGIKRSCVFLEDDRKAS